MFRSVVSAFLSLSIALSPVAASSQDYIFRYKFPVNGSLVVPEEPENPEGPEFEAGNDIQAWFVAPVGYDFYKRIPVATTKVNDWQKDSGETPTGLAINETSGEISGIAEDEQSTETLYYGFDGSGTRIARARMNFSTFKPVGQVSEVNWYTHTGEYFYSQIPAPENVSVVRWEALNDNPAGTETRNGALEGRPLAAGTYAVAWRGFDYLDREVAFTYGSFLVEDGPVVEEITDQVADKQLGESFNVTPVVKHSIGTITYTLKPVQARPSGLTFKSSDGTVTGVFDDFDKTAKFVIEARDSGDGTIGVSNEFTLTTLPEALDLSAMPDLYAVIGDRYERRIAGGSENLTFDLAAGQLPDGISLTTVAGASSARGVLSGTPTQIETQEGIQITASGAGAETVTSNPFKFRVFSEQLEAETAAVHARVNVPFQSTTPTVIAGADAPYRYATASSLPEGIAFNDVTGTFASDGVSTAGSYDQNIRIRNASDRAVNVDQIIRVYNNLTLEYAAENTATRLSNLRVSPTLTEDSVRSPAKFTIVQGANRVPSWMKFNDRTGVFSGYPDQMEQIGVYGPFVVSLVDGFNEPPVVSKAFTIRVIDRPDVVIEQRTEEVQRWVGNEVKIVTAKNAYSGVTFSLAQRGNLPSTLHFNADGFLLGSTTDPVGTEYTGIKVRAVDGIGYASELDIKLKVIEPRVIGSIDGSFDKTFTWTVDRDFIDFKLPRVSNTYGQVTYTLGDNPFGLQLDPSTLALAGKIPTVGTYTVTYTVADETVRAPITGTLTFDIRPDMEISQADFTTNRGKQTIVAPTRVNGIAPFKWEIVSGRLPDTGQFDPMTFDRTTGAIRGKPREEGVFPLTLKVIDKTLQERTVSFDLTVEAPLPFSFTYGEGWMNYSLLSSVAPKIQNQSEVIEWSLVSGTLPAGVSLVRGGLYNGMFYGVPREDGIFPDIIVQGTDTGTGLGWTETVTLKVRRTGDLGMAAAKLRHRAGEPAKKFALGAGNVTAPTAYELVGNSYPENVSVDPATGELAVAFAEPGTYKVSLKATDLFDRSQTVDIEIEMVGPLALAATDYVQQQYKPVSYAPTVTNAVGRVTYSLSPQLPVGLTFNPDTGRISGASDDILEAQLTMTAADSLGGASGTVVKTFTLKIDERDKPTITNQSVQSAMLDQPYRLTLSVANVLGTKIFEHVSGDLPEGMTFDAANGIFAGTPTTFGRVDNVVIRVTDTYKGIATSSEKALSFDVKQDGSVIEVTVPSQLPFRVDTAGSAEAPQAANTIGDLTWSISGIEGTGLVIDPVTGIVSGTPVAPVEKPVVFTVADITGRTATAEAVLVVKDIVGISFATDNELTYNYRFDGTTTNTQGGTRPAVEQPSALNAYGAQEWTISPAASLPEGLTFNTSTGEFEGRPLALGEFGPFTLTLKDSLPGEAYLAGVFFTVVMNDDPIDLAVEQYVTKVGYSITTAEPAFDNVLGDAFFFPENNDLNGTNLTLDDETGVLTGSFSTPQDRNINIAISDDMTQRVTSRPLSLKVLPLLKLTAPQLVRLEAQAEIPPVAVTPTNIAGAIAWQDLDQAQKDLLPEGITFDVATGAFMGETDEIGTFGPFTVTAIDTFHGFTDIGVSNAITLELNPGATYLNLRAGSLANTVKRAEGYSHDFMAENLDMVGIDEDALSWTLTADTGGKVLPGLTINSKTGVLSGTPSESGEFQFKVSVSGEGKSSSRTYSLTVALPEIALDLAEATLPQAKRKSVVSDNTYSFDFKPLLTTTNIPADKVVFSVEPFGEGEGLPDGLALANGVLGGLADSEEGTFSFRVTARFTDAPDEDISVTTDYTLDLVDELGFAFGDASFDPAKKRLAYSFDLNDLLDPESLKGVTVGDIEWSWIINPDRDVATTMATLPKGLALSGSTVSGTPDNSGLYSIVLTASAFGRSASKVVEMNIELQEIALALATVGPKDGEKDTAYSEDLKSLVTATNIPTSEIRWSTSNPAPQAGEIAGLPAGLSLNTTTGLLTGTPSATGTFRVTAKATWDNANATAEHAEDEKTYVIVINGKTYRFKEIGAGMSHSCGLTTDGGVKCWGNGFNGQVGNGGTSNSNLNPVDVSGLTSGVSSIAVGSYHSCAVTTSGGVKCWGLGTSGRIGNGSTSGNITTPANVSGLASGVVAVSAGDQHTCALTTAGGVKCWGTGGNGRLGNGLQTQQPTPVDVTGLTSGVASISAGSSHTCAVTTTGGAKCWGSGSGGLLGNGQAAGNFTTPVDVTGLTSGVASISAGTNHTCAVTSLGGAKCWGNAANGALGNGDVSGNFATPVDVTGLTSGVASISAGSFATTCATTIAGGAKCWGSGSSGVLGNGQTGQQPTPVDVVDLSSASSIDVGYQHVCAITMENAGKCWGSGGNGQLGNGLKATSSVPVDVTY